MNGGQHEALTNLVGGTLGPADLEQLVAFRLGMGLFTHLVPPGNKHTYTVFLLLAELDARGLLTVFLKAVMEVRPYNQEIQEGIPKHWPPVLDTMPSGTIENAGNAIDGAAGTIKAGGLERIVRENNPAFDIARWRSRLSELELRVCRVDLNGAPKGTGFLIGNRLVLTNHHVVAKVLSGVHAATALSCLFDFKILPGGQSAPGKRVALQAGKEILLSSPPTAAEETKHPDSEIPAADQLDFALLHLESPAGEDMVNGPSFPPRGAETLPNGESAMLGDDGIVIAQHPQGEPMKLAIDTCSVIGYNVNKTRLRYRTNTEGGSSGSPVYDMNLNLVALHHLGDPATSIAQAYNQGVAPLHLIRQAIVGAGLGHLLG